MKETTNRVRIVVAALAVSLSVPTFADGGTWDGQSWVYTEETHTPVVVATAEGTIAGLDAKARGLDATPGDATVDKWYWTWASSAACPISSKRPGMLITVR